MKKYAPNIFVFKWLTTKGDELKCDEHFMTTSLVSSSARNWTSSYESQSIFHVHLYTCFWNQNTSGRVLVNLIGSIHRKVNWHLYTNLPRFGQCWRLAFFSNTYIYCSCLDKLACIHLPLIIDIGHIIENIKQYAKENPRGPYALKRKKFSKDLGNTKYGQQQLVASERIRYLL